MFPPRVLKAPIRTLSRGCHGTARVRVGHARVEHRARNPPGGGRQRELVPRGGRPGCDRGGRRGPASWFSLRDALAAIGRPRDQVEALVLTHAHFDHIGFAERARTGHPQLGQVELRTRAADGDIDVEVQTRERAAGLAPRPSASRANPADAVLYLGGDARERRPPPTRANHTHGMAGGIAGTRCRTYQCPRQG